MGKSKLYNLFKVNTDSLNRKSNFELLRIISMVLIIAHHIAVHSGFYFENNTLNKLWVLYLNIGGKIGVNIFVLISGYFLINTEKLKFSKIFKLWLQIFFYSIIFYIISIIINPDSFTFGNLFFAHLPILTNSWWFASTYFILFLMSPYINILLKHLSKKQYLIMLAFLTVLWSVIPTILNVNVQSNSLLWFIYLYSVAGYVRLHLKDEKNKPWMYLIAGYVTLNVFYILTIFTKDFFAIEQLPTLIVSLSLFLAFRKINMPNIKIINLIASTTFGIYLIHDNNFLRYIIWQDIFKNYSYETNNLLMPYTILQIILVFTVCSIIEFIRIHFIERFYINPINKLAVFLQEKKERLVK